MGHSSRRSACPRLPRPDWVAADPGAPGTDSSGADAEDLLARFQEGDQEAFRSIVGAWQQRLVQFFFRLCWDRDRAEDFTQELFMRLMRGARTYRPEGRLSTFVYRIATNLWIDHYRSQRPRPRLYSLDQALLEKGSEPHQYRERAPEQRALMAEEKELLRGALEALTEPHRLVFELAVYQEMPYAEVSRVLGIPVGTVKSRMHNAVKALKGILADTEEKSEAPGKGSFRCG